MPSEIVLASGSAIRAKILTNAGIPFSVIKPGVDEAITKQALSGETAETVALALAKEKALTVSERTQGVTIGADQVLRFDGRLFDKVETMHEARARLTMLRNSEHELVGAVALARGGRILDTHIAVSHLTMRDYSDAFLDQYLDQEGEAILASVGCYQFEGRGAQLFSRIDGDYFAILGMALLPTLAMLRASGMLSE